MLNIHRIGWVGPLVLALALPASATQKAKPAPSAKLPAQMAGLGTWAHVCLPKKPQAVARFAQNLKGKGYDYLIVGAFCGGSWGLPHRGAQLTPTTVKAFHDAKMRIYGYSTAYFRSGGKNATNPDKVLNQAIRVLKMGADGVCFDDTFSGRNGRDKRLATKVFGGVRRWINQHAPNKVLIFSASADHLSHREWPWEVPVSTCDYFIPQEYPGTLNQGRKRLPRMHAQDILTLSQGNLDRVKGWKALGSHARCRLIPGITAYASDPPAETTNFLRMVHPYYRGAMIFAWTKISSKNQVVITAWSPAYRKARTIHDPSAQSHFQGAKVSLPGKR